MSIPIGVHLTSEIARSRSHVVFVILVRMAARGAREARLAVWDGGCVVL